MPDNDEDNWIIVADDSSPEGRKLKPQLLCDFKNESIDQLPEANPKNEFTEIQKNRLSGSGLIPHYFICPITRELMEKPVVAAGTFTFFIMEANTHSLTFLFLLQMVTLMNTKPLTIGCKTIFAPL